ncbi:phosphopantothenoylcysteine decarboxylase [Saccharicrinis sp. FJH54]|uniref:phosphopantothenoylcysteine decarboxylase domain-containing protein n=1 Tax=Saccharicrinis sp. FJH54 TaxID=3344665 RepID=UPI0035D493A7
MNKKVLITAGPTYEKIDPVRFIGNYSSGKMGFAIAGECALRGADVTLVAGPVQLQTPSPGIKRIDVTSAGEMYRATLEAFRDADIAILSAAVADFTPEDVQSRKVKRGKEDMVLRLKPTKDIAGTLGQLKKDTQIMVGFALETHNEADNAIGKLQRKNLDFIVLNSLNDPEAGFMHDTNKITIFDRKGKHKAYDLKSKQQVAADIIDYLSEFISE